MRKDNASDRCRNCAARERGAKGLSTIRACKPVATCAGCGALFQTTPSAEKRAREHYCSRACMREAQRVGRVCRTCSGAFSVARTVAAGRTNARGHFCCRACYEKHLCRTERITGRGSRWKASRDEAIRRAPFCALCGRLSRLEVHHIIPFRLTRDNTPSNLIPLCKACHKRVEGIFHDVERTDPEPRAAKLVLRSSLAELQAATFMKLKSVRARFHA